MHTRTHISTHADALHALFRHPRSVYCIAQGVLDAWEEAFELPFLTQHGVTLEMAGIVQSVDFLPVRDVATAENFFWIPGPRRAWRDALSRRLCP